MTFEINEKLLDDKTESINKTVIHKRNSTPVFGEDGSSLIHFEEIKITESVTATFRHTNDFIMESFFSKNENMVGILESLKPNLNFVSTKIDMAEGDQESDFEYIISSRRSRSKSAEFYNH